MAEKSLEMMWPRELDHEWMVARAKFEQPDLPMRLWRKYRNRLEEIKSIRAARALTPEPVQG